MLDKHDMTQLFSNKTILVTGGLGSIGSEIVRQLMQYQPEVVKILDNRETELFYARQRFGNNHQVSLSLADVRDKDRINKAIEGVDIIFHAAALKHVLVCEDDPFEAVKTNVLGTQNIIECAMEQEVGRVVLVSTDKVVNPTNVMGATKLLAERLMSAACYSQRPHNTKFGIVRFGNVLASRGSVLEIWDRQLAENQKITITDPEMTRFFMSIPESVRLVFAASYYADYGETFILKMPSIKIGDLAESFLEIRGLPVDRYEITGIRAGEKMHERLLFDEEQGLLMSNEEMFVRLPLKADFYSETKRLESLGFTKSVDTTFSSKEENTLVTRDKIKTILSKTSL
jgi:UDP-N-acetylglucosamine 4,6-dehydratase/5-epimerase